MTPTTQLLTTLRDLGLSDKEAEIYLCLTELGQAPASVISRRTETPRATTYTCLQNMVQRGFLQSFTKNKVACFAVIDPKVLLDKQQQLTARMEDSLPLFAELTKSFTNKPQMDYYEGLTGLKSLYKRVLQEASTKVIYGFLSEDQIDEKLSEFLYKQAIPERIRLGITAKILVPKTPWNKKYVSTDTSGHTITKYLTGGLLHDTPCEINLFGEDKVAIIIYTPETMCGVYFASEPLYKVLYSFFSTLWKTAWMKH